VPMTGTIDIDGGSLTDTSNDRRGQDAVGASPEGFVGRVVDRLLDAGGTKSDDFIEHALEAGRDSDRGGRGRRRIAKQWIIASTDGLGVEASNAGRVIRDDIVLCHWDAPYAAVEGRARLGLSDYLCTLCWLCASLRTVGTEDRADVARGLVTFVHCVAAGFGADFRVSVFHGSREMA